MKNYIVSENELKALFDGEKPRFDVFEPVEMIAEGEVNEVNLDSCLVGKENDYVKFDDLFRYLRGKSIKIFIQEVK